jgi:hypothetical protein
MSDRKHLSQNRGMIAGRAVVASAMSLLPVPILDELLAGAVRTTLLKRIAETRRIDATPEAIAILADVTRGMWLHLAIDATTAAAIFRSAYRSVSRSLRVARRVDEITATFAVATLFDHYCAQHHVGLGLDEKSARPLREAIDGAVGEARLQVAGRAVKRAARGSASLLMAGPRAIGRLVGKKPAPEKVETEAVVAQKGGLALFQGAADAWTDELVRAFDRRWRERTP